MESREQRRGTEIERNGILGHYSRICGETKSNESFSGGGHKTHICRYRSRLPRDCREAIEQKEEIFGFLKPSNISKKNISRLRSLSISRSTDLAELATVALDVALVHPIKRGRLKCLARSRQDLMEKLETTGLIWAHHL